MKMIVLNCNFIAMRFIKDIYYLLLDFIYPNKCIVCKEFVGHNDHSICSQCLGNFDEIPKKNLVNKLSVNDGIDSAFSRWYFKNGFDDVIHSLKYSDMAKLGKELGYCLGKNITPGDFQSIDSITAVPLHRVKYRDRGYNQAEWIGKGLADIWQIPFDKKILKRNRFTVSQTTLNKEERQANMANAFTVEKDVTDKSILVVDDVLTTGSTTSACAQVLKTAGAKQVHVLTLSAPSISDN